MRGVPRARWMAGAAVLALSLAACGGGGGGGESSGKTGGTFRLGIVEPTAIDPYNAQESEGILVAHQLFTGLVDVKADGTIVPKLAEQRSPNDNCTEWTFKIKQGTKFTNGEPVDAEAFIRGWTRAAKKSAASDVAYHLAGIQGFDQLQAGTTQTFAGLSAPDPYTLKVKLSQPDCEFDLKTYHTVFSPVPKVAGEANNKQYNDQPIGNGPFKMEGPWQHNTKITLVRNDDYGFEKAKLDRVEISILNPQNADQLEYQGFESGKFDWARMPTPQLPAAKAKYEPQGQWIGQDTNGMNYLLPITDNGPMKTKEARLAVSYAIDRQTITQGVFKGMQTPSTTIVPPAFKDFYQQGLCQSCQKQDPAKAKEYAQKANLPPGSAVTLAFNTGGGHDEWVQAVAQQLRDVLGWKVEIKPMPFKELLEAEQQPGATGLFRFAWGADYPTPDNYLFPLLHTKSINKDASGKVTGDNRSRWSNPQFDQLVDKARATKDPNERKKLYQQAEKIAIEEMALIPLWNRTQYRLANTKKFTNLELDFNENPTLAQVALK
ncbi:peptide ABC transporter substrate-binding protein [Carbonactinospora thermoautotrophica]|nr:ABC transporter substrate-binding protein [Carbonactinospora thermoautotrophica]